MASFEVVLLPTVFSGELDEEIVGGSFAIDGDSSFNGVPEDSDDVFAC